MEALQIGTYIRQKRLDLGLTQEELCEAISCSVSTLSRIENNLRAPSFFTITKLTEKLGLPSDLFLAVVNKYEIQANNLRKEIQNDTVRFRRSPVEARPRLREEILEKLKDLDKLAGDGNPFVRQFAMSTEAAIGGPEGPYSPEKRLELLTKAIKLTIPRFALNRISEFRYTMTEVILVNQIARTYAHSGDRKKAIDISRQLLQYIEENNRELEKYAQQFTLVAHNCAIDLALEKQYQEAVQLANKGWQVCVEYGESQFKAGFIAILAECYYFLGDRKQSEIFYRRACVLYDTDRDENNLAIMQREMKEHLGLSYQP